MEILVVEDDFISRNLLKKMLVSMGHQVQECENGQDAWKVMKARPIQLLITDWMMPEMDGLDLCRNIRNASFGHYIYIIMLTARDRKKDLVDVFQAGADDFIPKPFDPEELRARVLTGVRVVNLEERYKSLQNTLIESRNKLRIVFDSLPEEIVSLDAGLKVVSVNKALLNRLKCGAQAIVGKKYLAIETQNGRQIFTDETQPLVQKVYKSGMLQSVLVTGQDSQGMKTYQQLVCLPVKDENEKVFQTVLVIRDITEDRRKSEEIQALNKRLIDTSTQIEAKNKKLESTLKRLEETQAQMLQSEKMASIGQLAAGVAHEINNPTGFVSSNLKTLEDYQADIGELIKKYQEFLSSMQTADSGIELPAPLDCKLSEIKAFEKDIDIGFLMEDIADLINDCREGTERIKKIVLDLKDFAHPGEDKIQSTDINKGLTSTLNVVNNELKYKATVHQELGEIPMVHGYPQQLNQVFMNILVNAAQAIEKKGDIHIRTQTVDGHVEVMISDTGCGISAENLGKIFDPFFTTKDVGKGTGLGMNIAYNIIKKHNGTIGVQSEVGKGTTFTIRIPAES